MGKPLAENRRARHDYEFLEKFEGGLVLTGPEVKAAKAGRAQLNGAFLFVRGGELWLNNAQIARYAPAGPQPDYQPQRLRKVLVTRRELDRLLGKTHGTGLTLVPISLYVQRGLVKLSFALARGKRAYEKRETIKRRQAAREDREHT